MARTDPVAHIRVRATKGYLADNSPGEQVTVKHINLCIVNNTKAAGSVVYLTIVNSINYYYPENNIYEFRPSYVESLL